MIPITTIIGIYFMARAIGVAGVDIGVFFVIVPIVGVMAMLPSLNGLGIRESGFVYMLKAYMPAEKSFAISILYLGSLLVFSIIGATVYVLKKGDFAFKKEELDDR